MLSLSSAGKIGSTKSGRRPKLAIGSFSGIVIGASAGAIEALHAILPRLPSDFPAALLVVIHLPPDRDSVLLELFRAKCHIEIKEVEDKEQIRDGVVYFAPPDYHVLVEPDRRLSLSSEEQVLFSRPSIDVLFESAAESYGSELLGIVLSGGNEDGSAGLRAVIDSGGAGIVQTPGSAFSPIMPEAAIRRCPEAQVLSLEDIGSYLLDLAMEWTS